MENFEFALPTKVYFGRGEVKNIKKEIKKYGDKVLLVYGGGSIKKYGIYDEVVRELNSASIDYVEYGGITPNPKLEQIEMGIKIAENNNIDFVLAVGGGSVVDASKSISAGCYSDVDVWDYFLNEEDIEDAVPVGVVLTLAATGSEMNINAVITKNETNQKLAIHSHEILPKFAIMDPKYTETVPPYHTAAGISDIMAHVFEQYFSPYKEAVVTDRMAESIMKVCITEGPKVYKDGKNYNARANIMWASTIALNGLLSLGKPTDWASHKLAHELSAHYDLSHGATLSVIFPAWMEYVKSQENEWKFEEFGKNVWEIDPDEEKIAEKSIQKLKKFFKSIDIPTSLKDFDIDIDEDKFAEMASNVKEIYGEIGTFKKLDYKDYIEIYRLANI